MFTTYTGLDYLKIDVANAAGNDKLQFEERINWFNTNIPEAIVTMSDQELLEFCNSFNPEDIDSIELMFTGLKAYIDTFYNRLSGYRCQLDAVCSGASLMSCLTADRKGLENTGLLGNKRGDLYTAVHNTMKELYKLPLNYKRSDIKSAVMTFLYGSIKEPERVFDENEEVLDKFYEAIQVECNGAYELQVALTNNWNPTVDTHSWTLPDGFEAVIPVMVEKNFEFTVKDSEGDITVPYTLKVKGTKKRSVSNCANQIHSCDGLIVRELARRCMFDIEHIQEVLWYLINTKEELYEPLNIDELDKMGKLGELIYYYEESKFCSIRIVDFIHNQYDTYKLSKSHREKLISILSKMLQHGYIEMCAIHDCFTAHANNMNYLRYWYKEICADIVESNMLLFLYNQINPTDQLTDDIVSTSARKRIADEVRKSNYGLC